MEKTTDYAALLGYTYSEYNTVLSRTENGFEWRNNHADKESGKNYIDHKSGNFADNRYAIRRDQSGEALKYDKSDDTADNRTRQITFLQQRNYHPENFSQHQQH